MPKAISDPLKSGSKTVKNYSKEQEAEMRVKYLESPVRDTVNQLAKQFHKSEKSVISKLSHMGIYIVPVRTTKAGAPIVKKSALVEQIGDKLEISIPSLEKANKADLQKLIDSLNEWMGE